MRKLFLGLLLATILPVMGCGDKKTIEVNAPDGTKVEIGDGKVKVETPAADVDVKK